MSQRNGQRPRSADEAHDRLASNGTLRSIEAAYWRILGKRVRADNVLSGRRETFINRLRNSYAAPRPTNGAAHVMAEDQAVAIELPSAVERSNGAHKTKGRLPIPFFGLERQTFGADRIIFSCAVGARHMLESPDPENRYEHALYADRDFGLAGWNQKPLLYWDAKPKVITLFHKYAIANFVEHGTRMLWLDSRVTVTADVAHRMFASLDDHDLCLFRHYERDCVYDEILAVLAARRASPAQAEEYSKYLKERGFPRHARLYETGALAFRVSPATIAFCRRVFALCHRYIPRDQLTLPVALADCPVKTYTYDAGDTDLRSTPGVVVKAWPREER